MIVKDRYTGIILILFGTWIGWQASSFPTLAGLPYGPGLFPTIAAVGLGVCGLLIFISSFVPGRVEKTVVPEAEPLERRHAIVNTIAVLLIVVLYALFLERVGFILLSILAMLFLFLLLKVTWWKSVLLAIGVVFLVHFIFYSFLHVPLPWGFLEPIAW